MAIRNVLRKDMRCDYQQILVFGEQRLVKNGKRLARPWRPRPGVPYSILTEPWGELPLQYLKKAVTFVIPTKKSRPPGHPEVVVFKQM
jgi:hypothetical protein